MTEPSIRYITTEEVLYIHKNQIEEYGGSSGLRDAKLLDSALAQPSSGFYDNEFHAGILRKAAAYLFYISKNHPFIDGNKRTALATALIFLDLNGIELDDPSESLYDLVMNVSNGQATLDDVVTAFQTLVV